VEVRAYFQLLGGLNGGTIATILDATESGRLRAMGDPFLLDPPIAHDQRQVAKSHDPRGPHYDADFGAWVGPFFMGPTNTRVVRRSAALYAEDGHPYATSFVYQEFLKYDPPFARVKATGATLGIGAFVVGLQRPLTRRLLGRVLPKPGAGPSSARIERGWFTCDLLGFTEDGQHVRGFIRHQGDPSNHATVMYLCEAALALVLDVSALPGGLSRGGVLTPATGLGDVLADRLRAAGVRIEIPAVRLSGRDV
jgi:short subunit dehydrogenase-like uncharacterized protein